MLFRWRDIVAIIVAAALAQQAWNRQESLTAVAHLAFYYPQNPHDLLTPAILDVNGDRIPEGLVRYEKTTSSKQQHSDSTNDNNEWKLQVLDVGPLQRRHKTHLGVPFSTDIVLESDAIRVQDIQPHSSVPHEAMEIKPLSITSGHVNVLQGMRPKKYPQKSKRTNHNNKVSPSGVELNDRNRHFFCGTDWHDAVKKCGVPCPKGTATECPAGEKCYADTPCDYDAVMNPNSADEQQQDNDEDEQVTSLLADANNVTRNYHLTPQGGLPSVVTLWSNGLVTLHSIAASKQADDSKKDMKMRIQLMWKNRIFPLTGGKFVLDWEDQAMSFVSALDAGNGCGLVLVSGRLYLGKAEGDYEEDLTVLVALNARTGEVEWRSNRYSDEDAEEEKEEEAAVPVQPIHRGTTSMARRRSLIPNLQLDSSQGSSSSAQHCLTSFYRRPLLKSSTLQPPGGALPFSYWTEEDASIRTLHIDLEQPANNRQDEKKKPKRKRRGSLQYGKPNVVATHDGAGLQLRSLRNGRLLCHLALSEQRLYADFNHDGTLDSVHIALGSHFLRDLEMQQDDEDADDDYRFISGLAKRMMEKEEEKKKKTGRNEVGTPGGLPTKTDLCHLVALSGFPSKEELFSFRLCNPDTSRIPVFATPPLLVEPMYGKGWDILAAVNTGSVHRIRGATGWNQWKYEGKDEFPSWNHAFSAVLGRVDTDRVLSAMRPVILTGETGLVVLSVETGTLLASAKFPQRSIRRATFVDFDGDGTTDVIVQTNDAVWGYKIVVGTGSSVFLRILVGLLLLGLLLAMLRNRFGPTPGKRSTDS